LYVGFKWLNKSPLIANGSRATTVGPQMHNTARKVGLPDSETFTRGYQPVEVVSMSGFSD
jgi:hypothetical protein